MKSAFKNKFAIFFFFFFPSLMLIAQNLFAFFLTGDLNARRRSFFLSFVRSVSVRLTGGAGLAGRPADDHLRKVPRTPQFTAKVCSSGGSFRPDLGATDRVSSSTISFLESKENLNRLVRVGPTTSPSPSSTVTTGSGFACSMDSI